jgi:hypothetical protein
MWLICCFSHRKACLALHYFINVANFQWRFNTQEFLGVGSASIFQYSKYHDVSETDIFSSLGWTGGRHRLYWIHSGSVFRNFVSSRMPSSEMLRRVALVFLRSVPLLLVTAYVMPISPSLVTLMMEALRYSETSILTRATRHNILEDGTTHEYLL